MPTIEMRMKKINREVLYGAVLWFAWGIGMGGAKELGLYAPSQSDHFMWFGFGLFIGMLKFMTDCTEVILQKLESQSSE